MSWGLIAVRGQSASPGVRGVDQLALVFSYTDPQAGPSAKGALLPSTEPTPDDARAAATRPNLTVRLGEGLQLRPLPALEVQRLGLPDEPEWLQFFRPLPSGAWTKDPFFKGRFHPSHPNDVQATFFFVEHRTAEQMWVRLEREAGDGVYEGTLLNTAHHRPELAAGTKVKVRGAPGAKAPLWMTDVMAANAASWTARCEACSFDLVLESVTELITRSFPNAPPGAVMEAFTTRCALCGQTQLIEQRRHAEALEPQAPPGPAPAKWALVLVPVVLGLALLGWLWLQD